MSERPILLNSASRHRFVASVRQLARSPVGPRVKLYFCSLLLLLLTINGLNVASSFIGRDFMTAVAGRNSTEFLQQTFRYVGILLVLTLVATIIRWVEERLGLLWREFLTTRLVDLYIGEHLYHRLAQSERIANPDQRITDDAKAFTTTTVSFMLLVLNATLAVISFSGVLWSISPMLFVVAVSYATVGSAVAFWLGRPLIWINYDQFDREAELRSDLVQVREHSEFVALAHYEDHFLDRLHMRIQRLVFNYRKLIAVNRNLNFFTNGYNYLIQVIPVLVVAPMYIRGEIEFGVITQSTIAFAQLLGGFSLIVTQFQSISSFTAVVARLDHFSEARDELENAAPCPIEVSDGQDGLEFDDLTLTSPEDGRVLLKDLTLTVERGTRLLVTGPNEMVKIALFRATGMLWESGSGRIVRPAHRCICFVPERPYLPPGTLRQIFIPPECAKPSDEKRIHETLASLDLSEALERIGGLDVERDWDDILSLGELQRLAIARVLLVAPDYAFLDRLETTLEPERLTHAISMLAAAGITYVTISRGDGEQASNYDQVLELSGDGPWTLKSAAEEAAKPAATA
ncbi:MAG TPA: SbmA/BacA-like family transporter [Candidatus Binatia bacterium]|jgi:putative ATP-binding cassette transporter